MPAFRSTNARADVIAHPLPSLAVTGIGENVEPDLGPGGEALRDFYGLVQGVLAGEHTIDGFLAALEGEVGVQFDHGGLRRNGFGTVDLDLVVVLCGAGEEEQEREK